jgi:hypothetical protein
MRCPKCGYTSFPYLERCRKCGQDLTAERELFGVYGRRPQPLDLMLGYGAAPADAEATALDAAPATVDLAPAQDSAPVDAAPERIPSFDVEAPPLRSPLPSAAEAEPAAVPEPDVLDLSDVEDLPLTLREVVEEAPASASDAAALSPASANAPIFDLDLQEDLAALELESGGDVGSARDDERREPAEYVLEIDEDFEIDIEEIEDDEDERDAPR